MVPMSALCNRKTCRCSAVAILGIPFVLQLMFPTPSGAQTALMAAVGNDPTLSTTLDASEAEGDFPKRRLVSCNEYEGPYFTFRLGGGLLFDTADYVQDSASKQQFDLGDIDGLRDFR